MFKCLGFKLDRRHLAISRVQKNILSKVVEVAETLFVLMVQVDCIVNHSFFTTVMEQIHKKAYNLTNKP